MFLIVLLVNLMESLSIDVLFEILIKSHYDDLLSQINTCELFQEIIECNSDYFWKIMYRINLSKHLNVKENKNNFQKLSKICLFERGPLGFRLESLDR